MGTASARGNISFAFLLYLLALKGIGVEKGASIRFFDRLTRSSYCSSRNERIFSVASSTD
jgi:hypothetical protein